MEDKHFDAILAKNYIARLLAREKEVIAESTARYILGRLKEIEAYTGIGNQSNVVNTYETAIREYF